MLPLRDDQPSYSTPWVTRFLIALNLLIFLFEATLDSRSLNALIFQFGVVPSHLAAFLAGSPRYSLAGIPSPFLTSVFFPWSLVSWIGHMLFLYIFCGNVAGYRGHI